MPQHSVTAAVVQAAPLLFDTPRTVEKLMDLAADAGRRGADLIVFPEAFIGGYPKGLDFGARLGLRRPEGRTDFQRYAESAIDVPGTETELIGAAARAANAHLVVGVIERDGGTLYCSALMFGPDGSLLAKHRKLMPTALERLVWGFGDGSTLSVVDTPLGKLGSVICWENYMPLLRMAMYAKGIQLYCAPTVDDRDSWLSTMRTIALEGRCFVLSACQYLTRGDCPPDYGLDMPAAPDEVLIRGGSCIVSPLGEILAEPRFGCELTQIATLDMGEIVRGKFDLDVTGHYARPDIFKLLVNEAPQSVVQIGGVHRADGAD